MTKPNYRKRRRGKKKDLFPIQKLSLSATVRKSHTNYACTMQLIEYNVFFKEDDYTTTHPDIQLNEFSPKHYQQHPDLSYFFRRGRDPAAEKMYIQNKMFYTLHHLDPFSLYSLTISACDGDDELRE